MGYQTPKYRAKVQLLDRFASANLGVSVANFVKGAYEEPKSGLFERILNDQLTARDTDYIREKLATLSHLRDRRSPEEYACDLVVGWLVEDIVEAILRSRGLEVVLSSEDKGREFLRRPKATPDMSVSKRCGHTQKLELVKDFTGFWKKKGKGHLRDNKFKNLLDEDGVLVGLDLTDGVFFVEDAAALEYKYLESHYPYGGKPAYEINTKSLRYSRLEKMADELTTIFKERGCPKCGLKG